MESSCITLSKSYIDLNLLSKIGQEIVCTVDVKGEGNGIHINAFESKYCGLVIIRFSIQDKDSKMWLKVQTTLKYWLLVIVALVSISRTRADTASDALNRFVRAEVTVSIKSYHDTANIQAAWVAFFGQSLDNHRILQFYLEHSAPNNQRLLTSLPIQIYLQRQINYEKNFLGSIASDYGNFDGLIRQFVSSTIASVQSLLDFIQSSQGILAQLFGVGFDVLSNNNPYRSENQALLAFFNAYLTNTKRLQTEIDQNGIPNASAAYINRLTDILNVLKGSV